MMFQRRTLPDWDDAQRTQTIAWVVKKLVLTRERVQQRHPRGSAATPVELRWSGLKLWRLAVGSRVDESRNHRGYESQAVVMKKDDDATLLKTATQLVDNCTTQLEHQMRNPLCD
jgi:hypothetical protein